MILAAGRGLRMGALTQTAPKPLLRIQNHYLIEYAIFNLKRANVTDIVINVSYQAEQIKSVLGNGQQYGVTIEYSEEPQRLETGGGIQAALSLLGSEPFIVMSSDIITDYPLGNLHMPTTALAHLVLVDNPSFHPQGDFGLDQGWLSLSTTANFTFANIGIYRPELFADSQPGCFPLNQLLFPAIKNRKLTGEHYQGLWFNIGTPEELFKANQIPHALT